MLPPHDDLFSVLDEYLSGVQTGDVIVISSKVVAIGEGRCVPAKDFDREEYMKKTADIVIPRTNWPSVAVINHAMLGSAGADRSNSGDYYTLLPEEPTESAKTIHSYLCQRFNLEEVGVIISDSRSQFFRYGAVGCAIGFWGFHPIENHIGKDDLFGSKIKIEKTNLVDGIASGTNVLMGEVAESTPLIIVRGVPNLRFAEGDFRTELFCEFKDDLFVDFYKKYL